MGVHRKKKINFVKNILNGVINGDTQELKTHHFPSTLIKNSYTFHCFQLFNKKTLKSFLKPPQQST